MSKTMMSKAGRGIAAAIAVALMLAGAASAQEAAGDWHGTLTAPTGAALRIGVTVKPKAGGGYEGSLESPDQGATAIALDEVKAEAGLLSFSVKRIGGTFEGHWDAGRKAWGRAGHDVGVDRQARGEVSGL